jgi:hypothetical protein
LSSSGIFSGTGVSHPANEYPVLLGLSGIVIGDSYFQEIVGMLVHQFVLNVIE